MSTLYWLHDDLRLGDNPALTAAAQDQALTMLYCIDEDRFNTDRFGNRQMGVHRWRFLRECLLDLQHSLSELGQTLNLVAGNPREIVSDLLQTGRFNRVVRTRQHTSNETAVWRHLIESYPNVRFEQYDSATLYSQDAIPCGETFPNTFTQFRKILDAVAFRPSSATPTRLPAPTTFELVSRLVQAPTESSCVAGGETTGEQQLEAYFSTHAASACSPKPLMV